MNETLAIPEALGFIFDPPFGEVRYRVAYGGRGGAKSWSFARAVLIRGYQQPLRILCAREFQNSIQESVHHLLEDQIDRLDMGGFYDVERAKIYGANGTEILFHGIKRDPRMVQSLEGINLCWVEEAQAVSDESWRILIPTIREEGSEIWVGFNPDMPDDPTYKMFVGSPQDEGSIVRKVLWSDNPWLSDTLRKEQEDMLRRDPEAHDHVWGGNPWTRSDDQVFKGCYTVEDFEPEDHWDGPYFGADWGFANDPTVLTKSWIADSRLWVEYDERGVGWNMDEIATHFRRVPGAEEHIIRGDNARPETINELRRRGLKVESADKWAGSVPDGVEHLRTYEQIVIHPRCKGMIEEAKLYRHKTDARTGDVLPKIKDAHNHGWDSIRYALAPVIKQQPKQDWDAIRSWIRS